MGLMNSHYSNSPLCLQCWPRLILTMAKNTSWMEKKQGNRFSWENRDTIFSPVLIAKIFPGRLPACIPVNDGKWSGGECSSEQARAMHPHEMREPVLSSRANQESTAQKHLHCQCPFWCRSLTKCIFFPWGLKTGMGSTSHMLALWPLRQWLTLCCDEKLIYFLWDGAMLLSCVKQKPWKTPKQVLSLKGVVKWSLWVLFLYMPVGTQEWKC